MEFIKVELNRGNGIVAKIDTENGVKEVVKQIKDKGYTLINCSKKNGTHVVSFVTVAMSKQQLIEAGFLKGQQILDESQRLSKLGYTWGVRKVKVAKSRAKKVVVVETPSKKKKR